MLSRFARLLVVACLTLAAGAFAFPSAATAADGGCSLVKVEAADGSVTYKSVCPGDESTGTGSGPDSGSGGAPTCDRDSVKGVGDYVFCVGTTACAVNNPSHLDESQWPMDERPSPKHIYTFRWCETAGGDVSYEWAWYLPEDDGPTLEELARQAYGELTTPAFTLGFNPPGRTLVGVETWLWAKTASPGALRGTSAEGVVAIAEPAGLEVDPGDGTGVRRCDWSTTASPTCSVRYARSSAGQSAGANGEPSYRARARLLYDVRFEQNGAALDIAGLPTGLASPWAATAVPVAEIESLVQP